MAQKSIYQERFPYKPNTPQTPVAVPGCGNELVRLRSETASAIVKAGHAVKLKGKVVPVKNRNPLDFMQTVAEIDRVAYERIALCAYEFYRG